MKIDIYTDGSCHTQLRIGAWAAILLLGDQQILLKGIEKETTHNRMELLAVIKSVNHLEGLGLMDAQIFVYSDSQYVVNLLNRNGKLKERHFLTNKGTPVSNADLVRALLGLIGKNNITFTKVKAHQKTDGFKNFNREVDKIVRKLLRETTK